MDLKSVHEIFTNRILRIPAYQRGYSWSNNKIVNPNSTDPTKNVKGQLMDLWDDLINIPDGKWHYTGLLTLVEVTPCAYNWLPNFKQYSIVDGQQRITSILILLSVIIREAQKQEEMLGLHEGEAEMKFLLIERSGLKAFVFGYDEDNPSDKFFRKYILCLDEVEDDSEESTYTENLVKAKTFFEAMVSLYLQEEGNSVHTLFHKVTAQLKLNEYILPLELDEYVVFETMNNRGKPLSQLEKLKNRLLYLNDKFISDSPTEQELILNQAQKEQLEVSINKAWITIYKSLGQNKTSPLDDEDFIKNHWILYFNRYSRQEANVYANFLFDDFFSLDRVYSGDLQRKDIEDYIKSLQTCSVWWNKLHNIQFFEEGEFIRSSIQGIHQVGLKSSFKPLLLGILSRADRDGFVETIKTLEKYSFKLFDISDKRGNTGDTRIYALANEVYMGQRDDTQTKAQLEEYTSWYYSFNLFINQCNEMFEVGDKKGFYKWSGRFYLLFQYDMNLRRVNKNSSQSSVIDWNDFVKNDSIEHIYPQSATVSLEAYAQEKGKKVSEVESAYNKIQNDWAEFAQYTPVERRKLANSLGNLLAISRSDNSSLQNDKFLFKVDQSNKGEGYPKRGYKYDSMSAMIVANESTWTPEKVLERGLKILEFMCDYIGEDYGQMSADIKYKVLGLEFMLNDKVIENQPTVLMEANDR